ncbi:GNAT family N-acetyltransferase [Agrobacterium larrymoorei]|uniref:GNAT family N-acetyltransferase n=1 Tax=Agrobacterium larrymoorei TaxID=160699 RepID=A0AAF0KFG0_9HYPH|nr:GNAT family N-acetyltransferase [Agrobacterium larrymoorei]WHA42147.1 GNAT family N-acetyltransferase [Agrobacterium larrymoorei]
MPGNSAQPPFLIRASRPSDAEAITTLVNLPNYRWGTLRLPFQTLEETSRRWTSGMSNITGLVAEQEGALIGDLGLTRYCGRRVHTASIGMGVHDDHAGKGVGSALLAAAIDLAENWMALTRIELTVYTDNLAALALYRKFGFEVEGTMRKFAFRDGVYVDCFMMARLR